MDLQHFSVASIQGVVMAQYSVKILLKSATKLLPYENVGYKNIAL
jgi:hypothetical protein